MVKHRSTAQPLRHANGIGTILLEAAVAIALRAAVSTLARSFALSRRPPDPSATLQRSAGMSGGMAVGATTLSADPQMDGEGLVFTAKRVWQEIGKDRVLSVAGGLTFFGLLALFPAITAMVSIFGLFAAPQQVSVYLGSITSVLPHDAATILVNQAKAISATSSANLSLAAIIALALALWSANGGTKALIEALNVAYGVEEERSFLRLNFLSLVSTILGIVLALALIAGIAVLPKLLEYVWLGSATERLLLLGRWPAIFAVMIGVLSLAYRFAPNRKDAVWRWISPGAVFAAGGLVIFSLFFNWYVQNFSNYNETYGSLGAVVALMTWMWLSASLVLIGGELNSELDRQSASAAQKGPAAAPAAASR